jgi:hypothetical protein
MRTVRNITVCVSPELYRQTRQLAAKYDTTVSAIVAYLLERLPNALIRADYPVGGTKRNPGSRAPTPLARLAGSKPPKSMAALAAEVLRNAARLQEQPAGVSTL